MSYELLARYLDPRPLEPAELVALWNRTVEAIDLAWSNQVFVRAMHSRVRDGVVTERYLGSEQDLKNAVNDALVFE